MCVPWTLRSSRKSTLLLRKIARPSTSPSSATTSPFLLAHASASSRGPAGTAVEERQEEPPGRWPPGAVGGSASLALPSPAPFPYFDACWRYSVVLEGCALELRSPKGPACSASRRDRALSRWRRVVVDGNYLGRTVKIVDATQCGVLRLWTSGHRPEHLLRGWAIGSCLSARSDTSASGILGAPRGRPGQLFCTLQLHGRLLESCDQRIAAVRCGRQRLGMHRERSWRISARNPD